MNEKLGQFKKDIAGKKVAVIGLGISNIPLIKYLGKLGIGITAFDKADREDLVPALKALEGLKVEYSLGKDYLKRLKGFNLIFKTPGMRFDIPELLREADAGAEITSEMEVFCRLCPARLFGITGSDGKTTTATLIHRILEQSGYRCWLGGNVGTPLLDRIDEIDETDMVVLELSSFHPHDEKQDKYGCRDEYIPESPGCTYVDAGVYRRQNIFLYQDEGDTLVLNYDNRITRGLRRKPGQSHNVQPCP